ncbi:MAG: hypothetical protein JXR73_03885 [Candidatus Omnitrophica bacterium]|nr:hypothetical protein [Candidatus Omnitrophota bacterium]
MLYLILVLILAGLLGGGAYFVFFIKEDKRQVVLSELGLMRGLASSLQSPFYKWEWRKSSDDRVWGERIVRETFEKHQIGLSREDLEFFSRACADYATGKPVNKTNVILYVEKILTRSSTLSNFAASFIKPVLEKSLNASQEQAQRLLEHNNISSSLTDAPDRLAIRQFTKMLCNHGKKIICHDSVGLQVKDDSGSILMTLKGLENWEFWLKSCLQSLDQCLSDKSLTSSSAQAKFLRRELEKRIRSYMNHLHSTYAFFGMMEDLISKKAGEKSPSQSEEIQKIEKRFYLWHFNDETQFTLENHGDMHDLLTFPDFPPRFRQKVFENLPTSYDSLPSFIQCFPRHVIFYGKDSIKRHFAVQNYLTHFRQVNKTISAIAGKKNPSPLFLQIYETDVEKARNPDLQMDDQSDAEREKEYTENIVSNTGHMPTLLDAQKRMVIFERNLAFEKAEKMGWIIELPIEELTPKEYAQLDLSEYLTYKRINCDPFDDFGGEAEDQAAKFKKEIFLNAIYDVLFQDHLNFNET